MQKKLQVWWVPQVPMKAFTVDVATVEEGLRSGKAATHNPQGAFERLFFYRRPRY